MACLTMPEWIDSRIDRQADARTTLPELGVNNQQEIYRKLKEIQ